MKTHLALVLVAAVFLADAVPSFAATTNKYDVQVLAQRYLPGCKFRTDPQGKAEALVSATGEVLELASAARENPQPTNSVVGYWSSPTMDFLSGQKPRAATSEEAIGLVQLLHALWQGPGFVQQKLYDARPFNGGWVVQVDHDFTNYLSNVQAITPYELLVDSAGNVRQFRERSYSYPGSMAVYTNTVISVYEREIRLNRGRNYPEALYEELRAAWKKEQEQHSAKPEKAQNKE